MAINSLNKTSIKKHFRLCHRDERQASRVRLVIIENTIPNLLVTTIMPDPQFVDFKKVLRSHIKLGNAYQPRQIARMILQRLCTIGEKDLIYPTFSSSPHSIFLSGEKVPDSAGIDFLSRRRVNCDSGRGLYHPRKREPQEFLTELAEDVRDRFNND